ncbi:hypothetical protein NESM_000923600 [Novymonas esmeraldas]|uniref:Secreted protein n=1 Tax=Novymonas esmeraldas TaxID=1808958 RepID=A0AAW0F1L9_9TRYP
MLAGFAIGFASVARDALAWRSSWSGLRYGEDSSSATSSSSRRACTAFSARCSRIVETTRLRSTPPVGASTEKTTADRSTSKFCPRVVPGGGYLVMLRQNSQPQRVASHPHTNSAATPPAT